MKKGGSTSLTAGGGRFDVAHRRRRAEGGGAGSMPHTKTCIADCHERRSESNGKSRRAPWSLASSGLFCDRDMLGYLEVMASG